MVGVQSRLKSKRCPNCVVQKVSTLGCAQGVHIGSCKRCPHWVVHKVSTLGRAQGVHIGLCTRCPHWVVHKVSTLGCAKGVHIGLEGGGLEGLESVCPGTHCLAQFSDDNEWYRARVQSVSGNGTDVVVHFVDYGNSESTSLSSLLKCPPSLFKVPVQALHCSVFDSSSIAGVEWTEDAIEEFRAQLGDEALSLRVLEFESETSLCVCSLSSNGSPIDFSPLLSSVRSPQDFGGEGVDESSRPPVPGNQDVIEGLSSEPPYASSASSSSLPPAAAVAVTTSDGKTSEHSGGTSDDGRGMSSGWAFSPAGT